MTRASRKAWVGLVLLLGPLGLLASCSGDDTTSGDTDSGAADSSMPAHDAGSHDSASSDATPDAAPAPDAGSVDAADSGSPDVATGDAALDADADAATDADAAVSTIGNPALAPDASSVACPTVINGSLDSTDGTQVGRLSRTGTASSCGTMKTFPGNGADPTNPHYYDVYRFSNPSSAAVCFTFTLNDGTIIVADAGSDAATADAASDASDASDGGGEAAVDDAGVDATLADASNDAQSTDAAADAAADAAVTFPQKYLTAYSTFYPASLSTNYLGDIGNQLTAPQTFAITVPATSTIDVVVYTVQPAPSVGGAYTLSCTTP